MCSVKGKNLNDQSFCVSLIAGPALYRADWGRKNPVSEALLNKPADILTIFITGGQESLNRRFLDMCTLF